MHVMRHMLQVLGVLSGTGNAQDTEYDLGIHIALFSPAIANAGTLGVALLGSDPVQARVNTF